MNQRMTEPVTDQEWEDWINRLPQTHTSSTSGVVPRTIEVDPISTPSSTPRPGRPPGSPSRQEPIPTTNPSPPSRPSPPPRERRKSFSLASLFRFKQSEVDGKEGGESSQPVKRNPRKERQEKIQTIAEFWESFVPEVPKYFLLIEILSYSIKPITSMGWGIVAASLHSVLSPIGFITPFLIGSLILARMNRWKEVQFCVAVLSAYLIKFLLVLFQG